ncbi:uncharacterized protein [Choristoneura fumiferana]|uniref:uncharacterized protein n=1 Tax=Choristoneura fumiferana TaxID=7141 RepID=UPI003D15B29A
MSDSAQVMDMFIKNNQEKASINTLINKFVEQMTMESKEDGDSTGKLTIKSGERDGSVKDIDSKLTSLENLIKKLQDEIDEMTASVDKPMNEEVCPVSYSPSKHLVTEYELHNIDDSEPKHTPDKPIVVDANNLNKLDELSATDPDNSLTNTLETCNETNQEVKPCESDNSASEKPSVLLIIDDDNDNDQIKVNEQTKHNDDQVESNKEIDGSCQESKEAAFKAEQNNKVDKKIPVTRTVLPQELIYIDSSQIINTINHTDEDEPSKEIYEDCQEHEEVGASVAEEKNKIKMTNDIGVESNIFPVSEQFFFFESSNTIKAIGLVDEGRSTKTENLKENAIPSIKESEDVNLNDASQESILPIPHHCNNVSKKILNALIVNACFNELDKSANENDEKDNKGAFILVSEDLPLPLPPVQGTKGENDPRDVLVTSRNNIMLACKRYDSDTFVYDKDTIDEGITESKQSISEMIASLDCPDATFEFQDAVE